MVLCSLVSIWNSFHDVFIFPFYSWCDFDQTLCFFSLVENCLVKLVIGFSEFPKPLYFTEVFLKPLFFLNRSYKTLLFCVQGRCTLLKPTIYQLLQRIDWHLPDILMNWPVFTWYFSELPGTYQGRRWRDWHLLGTSKKLTNICQGLLWIDCYFARKSVNWLIFLRDSRELTVIFQRHHGIDWYLPGNLLIITRDFSELTYIYQGLSELADTIR